MLWHREKNETKMIANEWVKQAKRQRIGYEDTTTINRAAPRHKSIRVPGGYSRLPSRVLPKYPRVLGKRVPV